MLFLGSDKAEEEEDEEEEDEDVFDVFPWIFSSPQSDRKWKKIKKEAEMKVCERSFFFSFSISLLLHWEH